jgi:putative ABC transport system substrate-binding protein
MRRREFIAGLGAAAWPLAAGAQQRQLPVIGFLSATSRESTGYVGPFLQGLKESGFIEGQNVVIEYRWAEGRYERLPALAAELISLKVAVIAAGPSPAALAAKAATATIPIVFWIGADPVEVGLVASLNRPGGNLTGASFTTVALTTKRLEFLLELVPNTTLVALLVNPGTPNANSDSKEVQAAAGKLGRQALILNASTERDIDAAFATLLQQGAGGLLLGNDPFFAQRRRQIFALATRHAIPAIYPLRIYAREGGLMSYGTDANDSARIQGNYVGRILKGEKPADLPVQMPTRFQLVVNLITAKAIGLTIPDSFKLLADEVIE